MSSQILSNFKLFSENGKLNTTPTCSLKFQITLGIIAIIIFALVYFKRVELVAVFSRMFGELLTNTWLNSHLNSAGELATTYVPSNFSILPENRGDV